MEIKLSDVLFVGDTLRKMNAEINAALVEIGKVPVGSVPQDVAIALLNMQKVYDQARANYVTVYRTIWGSVPTGLGALFILGGVVLDAWLWLAAAFGVAGLIWKYERDLNAALQGWRERQRLQAIQSLPPAERAAALQQMPAPGQETLGAWLQQNALYVGAGVLVLVFILSRR